VQGRADSWFSWVSQAALRACAMWPRNSWTRAENSGV
jgi:hypothetical protein